MPVRNIATYNHMIMLYFFAFQTQLNLSKTTLKEKKDISKKQSQSGFKERIKFAIAAFEVF